MNAQVVQLFHVGPQKTGTTWVYESLREHPAVACPPRDTIHYFDMYPFRDLDWYHGHFRDDSGQGIWFDPTPSYLRSPEAAARIASYNPEAKIVLCARQPVERAFSHYWHEKKKNRFDFTFAEVRENYDLFANWVEPGLYGHHLARWLDHFPRHQILVQLFDDLERSPRAFLDQLLDFIGLDKGFTPTVLDRKVNAARAKTSDRQRVIDDTFGTALRRSGLYEPLRRVKRRLIPPASLNPERLETLARADPDVVRYLEDVFEPDIARLETLSGLDLTIWRGRSYD